MNPSRRRFLFAGAATLVAAPAIVRVAANLMPVSTRHVLADREMWMREWEFVEKLVWPPMVGMPILKNEPASIMPGWITYVATKRQGATFRPLFEVIPTVMQRRFA